MAKSVEGQEPNKSTEENHESEENKTPDPWEKFPAEFNWVRKDMDDLRKEAAARRVEAKELKEKLAEAKTPEEVQKLLAESEARVAEAELKATRAQAARKVGLDPKFDGFITGSTQEEIDEQVKLLAELKPAPKDGDEDDEPRVTKPRPRGGSNPALSPEGKDGHDAYAEWKASR
jgi:hypothetical protein